MERFVRQGGLLVLALIALALLVPGAAVAQSQEGSRSRGTERQLLNELDDARIYRNSATEKVGLIGTTRQNPIERPAGLPANAPPEAAARAHLSKLGTLFGLRD